MNTYANIFNEVVSLWFCNHKNQWGSLTTSYMEITSHWAVQFITVKCEGQGQNDFVHEEAKLHVKWLLYPQLNKVAIS